MYSVFWNDILERVNATSRQLQDPKLDLNAAVAMVVSLKRFVDAERETFTEYERHGATLYLVHQTSCRLASVHAMFASTMFRSRMLNSLLLRSFVSPVTFRYSTSLSCHLLDHRLSSYVELCSRFGFLGKLESRSPVEIESSADNLVIVCKDDLEQCFGNELVQFIAFSNGERSFSKLKYIKNRLRTTMTNERVTHLSLMSIEYDILRETDFDYLITDFAQRKGRKVSGL